MAEHIIDKIEYGGNTYKLQDNVSGYTKNTGTVTSVGITNGGGLSISGSPVTTSGSITVGHSNSVTAQTTQAVYPIKIDAQGHISAYGSAVTIPTDTNTTYTLSGALSSHKFTSTLTAGGSGSGTSTSDFMLAAGTGITITDDTSNRKMTIACSVTNTDEKVKQTPLNGVNSIKGLLIGSSTGSTETTSTVYTTDKIKWNDYSRNLYIYNIDGTKYSYLNFYSLQLADTESNYCGDIRINALTAARRWYLPDKNGEIALTSDITDTKVSTAAIAVDTNYYPVLGTNTTSATTKYYDSGGLRYVYSIDSESNTGLAELILGNGESSGTTGNKKGLVTFYSNNDKRVFLRAANDLTATIGIYLPASEGTLALTSQLNNYLPLTGGTLSGTLYLTDGFYLQSKKANSTTGRIVCGVSGDNTYMFGYGSKNSEEGATYLDGHVVNIRSNQGVHISALNAVFSNQNIIVRKEASATTAVATINTALSREIDLMISESNNGGVYDATRSKWIIYNDSDGLTHYNGLRHINTTNFTTEKSQYLITSNDAGVLDYMNTARIAFKAGTAGSNSDDCGYSYLILGNSVAYGAALNNMGVLRLYSSSTGRADIRYVNTTEETIHYLPAIDGTLLNTGTTSFTQTVTAGTEIAKIKINNTTKSIYSRPSEKYIIFLGTGQSLTNSLAIIKCTSNFYFIGSSYFSTVSDGGIKCLFNGGVLVTGLARFTSLTANDRVGATIGIYRSGSWIASSTRPTIFANGSGAETTITIPNAPIQVQENDIVYLRGYNASAARGSVVGYLVVERIV